jgi:opacity protein-like surface antigen
MKKLLLISALGFLAVGCAAQEEAVKPYHPTDDISAQSQGGKGEVGDGSEVHLDQVN